MPTHILQRLPLTAGRSTPASVLWRRLCDLLSHGGVGSGVGHISMRLHAEQVLRLNEAAGWTIACRSGSVWITQEADVRDVFLNTGESFVLDRGGLALILARQDSALALRPPTSEQTPHALTQADAQEPDSAHEVWLRAVYPECGPWNDPAVFRRSGLL